MSIYPKYITHLHDECHFSFSKNNIVFVQRNAINIFNNLFKRWHGRMNQLNEINHTLIRVSYNSLKDIILVQIINKTSVVISFKCHNIIKHKKSHLDDVFVWRATFFSVAIFFCYLTFSNFDMSWQNATLNNQMNTKLLPTKLALRGKSVNAAINHWSFWLSSVCNW